MYDPQARENIDPSSPLGFLVFQLHPCTKCGGLVKLKDNFQTVPTVCSVCNHEFCHMCALESRGIICTNHAARASKSAQSGKTVVKKRAQSPIRKSATRSRVPSQTTRLRV